MPVSLLILYCRRCWPFRCKSERASSLSLSCSLDHCFCSEGSSDCWSFWCTNPSLTTPLIDRTRMHEWMLFDKLIYGMQNKSINTHALSSSFVPRTSGNSILLSVSFHESSESLELEPFKCRLIVSEMYEGSIDWVGSFFLDSFPFLEHVYCLLVVRNVWDAFHILSKVFHFFAIHFDEVAN